MTDYFDSPAIGSSVLAAVIEGIYRDENEIDRPRLCFDRATIPVKPSGAMEAGKMFEDLVEETYSDKKKFSGKYFKSELNSFPAGIPEFLSELDAVLACPDAATRSDIDSLFHAAFKTKKDGDLAKSAKNDCLKEIQAHDYRRPVPAPLWDKLQIMLDRFGNYPFYNKISNMRGPIRHFMQWDKIPILFQVEHFWIHESGAECRAKFDMVWVFEHAGKQYALCFDLKTTENWLSSLGFWRNKHIWQSLHYNEGFKSWCAANGYIPADNVWYLIQESAEPQITHARILSDREYIALNAAYNEAIEKTWEWIEAGKPVAGYVEQEIVDRYGKPEK